MLTLSYQTSRLSAVNDNGFLQIQPDYFGGTDADGVGGAGGVSFEAFHPFGVFSRPLDPDVDEEGNLKLGGNLLVAEQGSQGFAMPCTDPRFAGLVSDPGKGGGGLALPVIDGTWKGLATAFFSGQEGADGKAMGSFTVRVPYAQGAKTHLIEVDLTNARIRLTHGDGPIVEITAAGVALGAAGGQPVMIDAGFTAWLGQLVTALAAGGIVVPSPPTVAATLVTAT